jgi:hypothetical protein
MDRRIWTADDFARQFLTWLVATHSKFRNSRVCVPDIESDLLPRFKADHGCPELQLGTLLRGLRNVSAGKHENVPYLDPSGRRRTMTEYEVRQKQDC